MTQPPSRRQLCEELAQSMADDQGLRQARLFHELEAKRETLTRDVPERKGPRPFSVWRPETRDGALVFVRPDPGPLGDHYAARREIKAQPEEGVTRICYFGESAAAGYLYAPHFTPAMVLERQLNSSAAFEVVDLARTNETLSGLAETVEASLQLEPQALVIFTGNNWNLLETPDASAYAPSCRARMDFARTCKEQGWEGPLEAAVKTGSRAGIEAMSRIANAVGEIPVVLVIPEVNLNDWTSRQPTPWLDSKDTAGWHRLFQEGEALLAAADWDRAERVGLAMLELDGGVCPTSYAMIALARMGQERIPQAEKAFRAEVDSAAYALNCFLDAPRTNSMVRRTLQVAAGMHGWNLLDLKGLLGQIPDRDCFADYCHLTAKGMNRAMAGVADRVLAIFGKEVGPFPEIWPEPEVEALAMFGAALHGAHRLLTVGPKRPVLQYWCERSLEVSPGIARTMLDFVASRLAPCPPVMTPARESIHNGPYPLNLQHGWKFDHIDAEMILAMEAALEARGFQEAREIPDLLVDLVGLDGEWRELWPFYLWEPLERPFPDVMLSHHLPERAFSQFPWPITGVALVRRGGDPVELSLTLRLPRGESGQVVLKVNGGEAAVLEVEPRWGCHRVMIPGDLMRKGLNKLTLHWPDPQMDGETAMARMVEQLELGREARPHPIFGEMAGLKARRSKRSGE